MATSQNGWPAVPDYGDPRLTTNAGATVPGTTVMIEGGILAGDVATVLLYVASRFSSQVESLVQVEGCWGFEPRDIIGSNVISNHASGTAMDLNANRHPLAVHGTFSSAQVTAIHRILADCHGVVRWGGDYTGRVDEMHFEINTGPAEVAALASILRTGPTPTPTPTPTPIPLEDDDMYSLYAYSGKDGNGAVFAGAPGRFFHVTDVTHLQLGDGTLWHAGSVKYFDNVGDLDVIRDNCISNYADKCVNFTSTLPSDFVLGKAPEPHA